MSDSVQQWDNLLARLRSVAGCRNDGHIVVQITVAFCGGVPRIWTEPRVVHLEPRSMGSTVDLLEALAGNGRLDS